MSTSLLSILSTCFWICLVFTVFFFLLSVVLFFVFDIKSIFNAKTGRAQAKTVKEMKAANESTGRLRVDGKTQTSKLSKEEIEAGRAPLVVPPTEQEKEEYYSAPTEPDGAEGTAVLSQPTDETVMLTPEYNETSVLSQDTANDFGVVHSDSEKKVGMNIIKKELYIHTNEVIS